MGLVVTLYYQYWSHIDEVGIFCSQNAFTEMDSPYVGADKEPGILSKIVLQYTAQNNPLFMYPLSSLINRKIYPIRLGMTDRPTPLIGVQLNEYLGH